MECNHEGYSYDTWYFFYEDFNHFTTKDFGRLGQYHLKELRRQLKEEYRPPSTNDEYDRFLARFEALVIEAPVIEAPAIEAPVIEAPVIEAPAIEALPIEAPPVDTNEPAILVETDEPAIPSANTTELSVGDTFTFTINSYFASSIPNPLSTTTLILPQLIPPPNSYLAYTLISTYTLTEFGFQALQRTGVG
ncbi:hypothetical protein F5882DRAFT_472099 [Hyaloscypha sp. PMI_1271]|nr:hypothetical protein F5882DRAFT_472099 [Hyaloscypha sp. PMI_1271]